MTTQLYRERQLWSGNGSIEIRYVSGSFVARKSALSPGVPRQMSLQLILLLLLSDGFIATIFCMAKNVERTIYVIYCAVNNGL